MCGVCVLVLCFGDCKTGAGGEFAFVWDWKNVCVVWWALLGRACLNANSECWGRLRCHLRLAHSHGQLVLGIELDHRLHC